MASSGTAALAAGQPAEQRAAEQRRQSIAPYGLGVLMITLMRNAKFVSPARR